MLTYVYVLKYLSFFLQPSIFKNALLAVLVAQMFSRDPRHKLAEISVMRIIIYAVQSSPAPRGGSSFACSYGTLCTLHICIYMHIYIYIYV